VNRYKKLVALRVFDSQVLALDAFHTTVDQPRKRPMPWVDMDNPVANLQIGVGGLRGFRAGALALAGFGSPPAEYLTVGEQMEHRAADRGEDPAFGQAAFQ